jgi:SAM-dependent methyltransferase
VIETWSRGVADAHMPEAILTELAATVRRHPWWRARGELVAGMLEERDKRTKSKEQKFIHKILDVGCGWGVTLECLEERGYRVAGLDVARGMLEALERPGRRLIEADLTQPLPAVGDTGFDAVLALDVIEHLDDDAGALANLAGLLRPGGLMVVSVPALAWLTSEFDRVQGHRRRYGPGRLRSAFDRTGLELERVFWWGCWMVPVLAASRLLARKRPTDERPEATYARHLRLPSRGLTAIFEAAFAFERPLAARGWLPVGTSLFAVARKPE